MTMSRLISGSGFPARPNGLLPPPLSPRIASRYGSQASVPSAAALVVVELPELPDLPQQA